MGAMARLAASSEHKFVRGYETWAGRHPKPLPSDPTTGDIRLRTLADYSRVVVSRAVVMGARGVWVDLHATRRDTPS